MFLIFIKILASGFQIWPVMISRLLASSPIFLSRSPELVCVQISNVWGFIANAKLLITQTLFTEHVHWPMKLPELDPVLGN